VDILIERALGPVGGARGVVRAATADCLRGQFGVVVSVVDYAAIRVGDGSQRSVKIVRIVDVFGDSGDGLLFDNVPVGRLGTSDSGERGQASSVGSG
jgi:hypothetical protein